MAENPAEHSFRWLLTILFGMFVIWTGLLASIQAHEFKPNAFGFCTVMGLASIAGGYLYRIGRDRSAMTVTLLAAGLVLGYYLYAFVTQPEQDATVRVGLVIVAAIGELVVVTLPGLRRD